LNRLFHYYSNMTGAKKPVRILITDDLVSVQKGLQAVIQLEDDLEVVGLANNGLEAIELASSLHPDIILMDIAMPYLDGIEAAQIILQTHTTIIIGMHTQSDQHMHEQAVQAGMVAFIEKDVPIDMICDVIRSAWCSAA
jgi:DNA-binding NarL/FixJ family response regulator